MSAKHREAAAQHNAKRIIIGLDGIGFGVGLDAIESAKLEAQNNQQSYLSSLSDEQRTPLGGMRLMTPEIAARLPIDADAGPESLAVAKYFAPCNQATWYVVAGGPDTNRVSRYDDDYILFGCVCGPNEGDEWEWGDFSIRELESISLPFCHHIERDIGFVPTKVGLLIGKGRAR